VTLLGATLGAVHRGWRFGVSTLAEGSPRRGLLRGGLPARPLSLLGTRRSSLFDLATLVTHLQ
jgi:hypothetical protein